MGNTTFPRTSPYSKETMNLRTEIPRGLIRVPPELLELIFLRLDSIDDVHSLGRTHSSTYHVIKRQTVYTAIMRSIIGRSWQHRYDLQLCNILSLHRDIVTSSQQNGLPLPVSVEDNPHGYNYWDTKLMNTTRTSDCNHGPCAACIPDTAVHEILARYQGMRVLEAMWLERQLEEQDFLSPDSAAFDVKFLQRYKCLLDRAQDFASGGTAVRARMDPATQHYTALNHDQRGRFYSAILFVWILNELRWALTMFDPRSQNHHRLLQILGNCRKDLINQSHEPVLDEVDQYAAFVFLYHHILPVHGPVLEDQNSSNLPLTFSRAHPADGACSAKYLRLFLLAGQVYLQPPDLIDLAVRNKMSRSAPYPRMNLSATTLRWVRPSDIFIFPANVPLADWKTTLERLYNIHVNIIRRSFFQHGDPNYILPAGQPWTIQNAITDLSRLYFSNAAIVALETDEIHNEGRRSIRDIFGGQWQRQGLWSVWWWANSEDKARAIIARWREEPYIF